MTQKKFEALFHELDAKGLRVVYSMDPDEDAELLKTLPPFSTFITTNFPSDFEEELEEDGSAYAYFSVRGSGFAAERAKMRLTAALKLQKRFVTVEKNGELSTLVDEGEFPRRWPPDPRPVAQTAALAAALAARDAVQFSRKIVEDTTPSDPPAAPDPPDPPAAPEVSHSEAQEPEEPTPVPPAPPAPTRGRPRRERITKEDFLKYFGKHSKSDLAQWLRDINEEPQGNRKKPWMNRISELYAEKVANGETFVLPRKT